MNTGHYIRVIRKWLWLILVSAFIGGGIAFILTSRQIAYYTAQTTLSIGQAYQDPNPSPNQLYIGQGLVATYQELVQTRDVLQSVVDALKLSMTPDQLGSLISTDIVENTSLLVIHVRYADPILTADIANGVANSLIAHSPTNLTAAQQDQFDLANTQIQSLTQEITQERAQVAQIDQALAATEDPPAATEDPSATADLNSKRTALVDEINQASAALAQFQVTIASIQQRTNVITIVDPAIIPATPISSSISELTALGAVIGVLLAVGLIFCVDYIDDRLHTVEAATMLLSIPVVGAIPRFGKRNAPSNERLITSYGLLSDISEAYRRLRTNLIFMTEQSNQKVIVISSPGPGEGKSLTSANLAATMALAGMRVLLIDADLRRPQIHKIFGLENNVGLSTLLLVDPNEGAFRSGGTWDKDATNDEVQTLRTLDQCVHTTEIPNLKVITSGIIPTNPSEILGSMLMKRWVDAFRAASNIDVIIIDTPPTLLFTDSSILSTRISADLLLIMDSTKTRRKAAVQARDQLQQVGVVVKGAVLNRLNPRDEASYYGSYYGGYYTSESQPTKRNFRHFFGR